MNFTTEDIRQAYAKAIQEKENKVDVEDLRALGYSEEDIKEAQL